MKQVVDKLHMQYAKVKSMTGFCNLKVYEIYAIPESCKKLHINGEQYVRVPTLFDPGSDGAAHTQDLGPLCPKEQNHQCDHCEWH